MKKFLLALLIIIMTLSFAACSDEDVTTEDITTGPVTEKTVTVTYKTEAGGKIIGEATQSGTTKGSICTFTEVRAEALEGYIFAGWSDGKTSDTRTDILDKDSTFTAIFRKIHTVKFVSGGNGSFKGTTFQEIIDGGTTAAVTARPDPGYRFVSWSDGSKDATIQITPKEDVTLTANFEIQPLSLPIFHINTENSEPILSKEIYVPSKFSVTNAEAEHLITDATGKVKGRGNTSWKNDKKPYHIEFDTEVDLFGNGAAKGWNLISNHTDYSMVRNYLAYTAASKMSKLGGMGQMQFVELYVNGSYDGVYLICEQIEIHEKRVNLTETGELDTGYIVELDGRGEGDCFVVNNKYYAMKAPKKYSKEQKNYIGMYVYDCLNAIKGEDWEVITSLMDVESFAESYLIHEIHKCCDVGYASFYMVKDAGGKLAAGPVWDFDRSLGNVYNKAGSMEPAALFASKENEWFAALLKHPEFVELVKEKLKDYNATLTKTYEDCFTYVESHKDSFERNDERWDIIGTDLYPNPSNLVRLNSWQLHLDHNKDFLNKSMSYLLKTYGD